MRTACLALLILLSGVGAAAAKPCVILLHGLGRTSLSLAFLEHRLSAHGYRVVNRSYASREATVAALAPFIDEAIAACGAGARPHFVTHSMGGILLRAWRAAHTGAGIGRVVMLAPPNRGSALVAALAAQGLAEPLLGPAGASLGPAGVPVRLPQDLGAETGIIAGDLSLFGPTSALLPGPDDGVVSVAATRLDGARDHIVISASHTFMMNDPMAVFQVLTFLRHGGFAHDVAYDDLWRADWPEAR